MWADVSDTGTNISERGTGIHNVDPHDLVEGYTQSYNKYFAINPQDSLQLQIWDNRGFDLDPLERIGGQIACFGFEAKTAMSVELTE